MRLTKTFGQYKQSSAPTTELESELRITVDYCPVDDYVTDEPVTVESYNVKYRRLTDLTAIFNESLSSQLESMIQSVDWRELYQEKKADKRAA